MTEKSDNRNVKERDDIFIVKVTGKNTKTINIPDAVCDFSGINSGDIIKLKVMEIKPSKDKNEK